MAKHAIILKRIYDPADPGDGTRILVERLWPRGIKKENAHIDLWLKEVAPSSDLRKWFSHDPARFSEFRQRYEHELASEPARSALAQLQELASHGPITLLFSAKDTEHNNAIVLRDLLRKNA